MLAGAAIGNGNRGVEALARAVADGVEREGPGSVLSILDDGWGVRGPVGDGHHRIRVERVGVRRSRRWHRQESWARIRLAQTLGLRANPTASRIAAADAVLDLSGGDSFTDLYGPQRLAAVSEPKWAALRAGRPLVLLPQTYGPFATASGRRTAERIIRSAALAYARDPWSHDQLLALAGEDADRTRLRRGVDVAFALEPRRPEEGVAASVEEWGPEATAGVNVSGLLRDAAGRDRFGLAGDYLATMTAVVRDLVAVGALVVLVPHVHQADGGGESDVAAIAEVLARLTSAERERTRVLPPHLDAAEVKWAIGRLDWFVGSRMHATIAALSTGTPVSAYAYSDKTLGVFETCGMGEEVVDARRVAGAEAVAALVASFHRRETTRPVLARRVSATVEQSRTQMRTILETVGRWRDDAAPVEAIA